MVFKCSELGVHLEAAQRERQGQRCLPGCRQWACFPGQTWSWLSIHHHCTHFSADRADSAWGCLYFSWERTFVPLSLVALRWKSCRQEGADLCQTVSTAVVAFVRQPSPPVPVGHSCSVTPSGVRLDPLSWPPSCGAWTLQAGYQVPLEVLLQIWWGCPLVGS